MYLRETKWFEGQPNGGRSQNFVAYKKFGESYACYDEEDFRKYWTICKVPQILSVSLLGACPETFLGKRTFFTLSHMIFVDLQYNIIMEDGKLVYSGLYSVDIRLY